MLNSSLFSGICFCIFSSVSYSLLFGVFDWFVTFGVFSMFFGEYVSILSRVVVPIGLHFLTPEHI